MQREPPPTDEGWYALHDLRRVDWDAWRDASAAVRGRAIEEGERFLADAEAVADADAGQSAAYVVQGHAADLMVVHLRPSMADLDALERGFETTAVAAFTERADSFLSVTEVSGYGERAREYFEGDLDPDSGLATYVRGRLHPDVPDDEFVSFYPMRKRRRPEQNWYDLPFAERAEHVGRHGDIGRAYGGRVTQMITGAMGMDDWEWGVTLWADDLTDVKQLLAEMRFDQSTSKFAEFGSFYAGRRIAPGDLEALLAGARIPGPGEAADAAAGSHDAERADAEPDNGERAAAGPPDAGRPGTRDGQPAHDGTEGDADAHNSHAGDSGDEVAEGSDDGDHRGGSPTAGGEFTEIDDVGRHLGTLGVHEGEDYEAGDYGLVFYADADAEDLTDDVADIREGFAHYDRHRLTSLRAGGGRAAVVSVWTAKEAAGTAAGFLGDVDAVTERYGGRLGDEAGGEVAAADDAGGTPADADPAESIREELADLGVYAGRPHGEDVYALVLYTRADEALEAVLSDLRAAFADDADHVETAVYDDRDSQTAAVVSLWASAEAADGAAPALAEVPDVVGRPGDGDGFATMGMFYTVKPGHREDFVATFEEVEEVLGGMDGHRETALLVDREAENDMFIASRWDDREDAMAFFRSDDFAETVRWGRDVLVDRPRHVFLA